jgi:hypothetical protein
MSYVIDHLLCSGVLQIGYHACDESDVYHYQYQHVRVNVQDCLNAVNTRYTDIISIVMSWYWMDL